MEIQFGRFRDKRFLSEGPRICSDSVVLHRRPTPGSLSPPTEPITESGIKGAPRRRINARGEKNFSLSDLSIPAEREKERDRFDAPLKVNNRLETPATTPIFFPKRDEIFSSQLLLSPRSFPARKRETRDSLYRVLYRFLHQFSRSNRFFIQFMYASHHFKAQVWKFGDARERQGGLQRFEERRWLLKSLSEANLSFPAFYFRIYPRILGVRESRRNIGQSGPSLNNRSRLRYKAWCLLRFGKVSHSGAENLINRRPEETGSFVLAC